MRVTLLLATLLTCALWSACSSEPNPARPRTKPDAGWITEGEASFDISTLDADAFGDLPLALAVQGTKIAVAYFAELPTSTSASSMTSPLARRTAASNSARNCR